MRLLFNYLLFFICFCGSFFYSYSQQANIVDFKNIKASITFEPLNKKVKGELLVNFTTLTNTNEIYLDARNFKDATLKNTSKKINIAYAENKIYIKGKFKKDNDYTVSFNYETQPKKALYFWGWNTENIDKNAPNHKQIWSQGQGKYTSHWLPSIDDMNDKIIFDLSFSFNKDYQVLSNGNLIMQEEHNGQKTWHYQTPKPMSSYLVAVAIGKYEKNESNSLTGVQLENYIYPERIKDYEPTYRYQKQIFDFLETEIGVPYPWGKTYRQVPVRDFIYAGMENTGCTIFSDDFIVNKNTFEDKNYASVNAHELAHQWFGNLITETNSNHHWLHEGFATYYALLAEKELFGNNHYYFKLYENAELLEAQNARNTSTPLITDKGNSLTYYQRGAWALLALEKEIGKTNFKKAVKLFLNRYAYKNVTTDNFLSTVVEVSKKELSSYAQNWLHNNEFPTKKALAILTESKFMEDFLLIAGQRTQPLIGKYTILSKALDFPANSYVGQEVVEQLHNDTSKEAFSLLNKAFETGDPQIELSLATSLTTIPENLEPKVRKLLKSRSYATVEGALYNLWNNFEDNKKKYLTLTENIEGYNSKNVRTLWLVLALNTPGFTTLERSSFFNELQQYTATNHNTRLRQNAFRYLELLNSFSDQSLINLSLGATHPSWQFNKYCTKLIKNLVQKPKYLERFRNLKDKLPTKVKELIQS